MDKGELIEILLCRRRAPVIPLPGGERWPEVVESEWCGDYEASPNTLNDLRAVEVGPG